MGEGFTSDDVRRFLLLTDANTRTVVLGTLLLGLSSGLMGSFLLLRKRALMGDAASHATLPGIALAFLLMVAGGGSGKFLPGLLVGGLLAGFAGIGLILFIRRYSRIREDAALGIVLSVFFGLGMVLLSVVQQMPSGGSAGLKDFIFGSTAGMVQADAVWMGVLACVVTACCAAFFKELTLLCFDQEYAAARGYPVLLLDAGIMVLAVVVIVIGLQAVGMILMVALLVIPPAAARFWTHHLRSMVWIAAGMGAASGYVGCLISALVPRLPTGAVIVLVAAFGFLVSLLLGRSGVMLRGLARWKLRRTIEVEHYLRAIFEWHDRHGEDEAMPREALRKARGWSMREARRVTRQVERRGLAARGLGHSVLLTDEGRVEAQRLARNHRLWELYLMHYADVAPSHVDRTADRVEHVLSPGIVAQLEQMLEQAVEGGEMPHSPHALHPLGKGHG